MAPTGEDKNITLKSSQVSLSHRAEVDLDHLVILCSFVRD